MNKNTLFFLPFAFLLCCTAASQTEKLCGTDRMVELSLSKNPELKKSREQLEIFTKNYLTTIKKSNTVYIIPVVFHIIHNYGSENVSKAQVLDALRILNEDSKKQNADTVDIIPAFKALAAGIDIEFRLAKVDPYGNCTEGITRTASELTYNADDNVKSLISWDTEKYFNVWIVEKISFDAGGYAYYPGSAPQPGYEGVVVVNSQFGSIGTSSGSNFAERTLTHETGHYLNLAHTWGSTNDCGSAGNCSSDDGVGDTPNTLGNCLTCDLTRNSCGELENVQNYMDYATCTKMFTDGQKDRMTAALNSSAGSRNNLWTQANLTATGTNDGYVPPLCTPVADFYSNYQVICTGATVYFTDVSYNGAVTGRAWAFEGGMPATSPDSVPAITYNYPGTYPVSLTVTNGAGSNTIMKEFFVAVLPSPLKSMPYTEGFENTAIPGPEWGVINNDNANTWEVNNTASFSGGNCLMMDNFGNTTGEVDEIISTTVDLGVLSSGTLISFKTAYAQTTDSSSDLLRLYVSGDCGNTWILRWAKKGANLATSPVQTSPFVPADTSEWKEWTATISSTYLTKDFRYKFQFTSGGGNYLYIDDIMITGIYNSIPVLVSPPDFSTGQSLFPLLDWKSVTSVDSYQVQIDTVVDFSSPALFTAGKAYISASDSGTDTRHQLANLSDKENYFWRVRSVTSGVPSNWSSTWRFATDTSVIINDIANDMLEFFVYPNPVQKNSSVVFSINSRDKVFIDIMDVFGRQIIVLNDKIFEAGHHVVNLPQLNPAGIYLVRIFSRDLTKIKKILAE